MLWPTVTDKFKSISSTSYIFRILLTNSVITSTHGHAPLTTRVDCELPLAISKSVHDRDGIPLSSPILIVLVATLIIFVLVQVIMVLLHRSITVDRVVVVDKDNNVVAEEIGKF